MRYSVLALTQMQIAGICLAAAAAALLLIMLIVHLVYKNAEKKRRSEQINEISVEEPVTEEPAEEPVAEAAEEPAEEPVAEAAEEPAEEPAAEAAEEPAEEPVAEATEEPAAAEEPAEEPVAEATEEPAAAAVPAEEPVAEAAEEPAEEPAAEAAEEPAEEPAAEAAEEPAEEPAAEAAEEPAEEPAAEAAEEPAEEPAAEAAEEPAAKAAPAVETGSAERKVIYTSEDGWFVNVRYDRSFTARLIQSDERVKGYYSQLKNALLSYKKVTARTSWQHEAFRRGRVTVAKLVLRGKTLRLYLSLDPVRYEGGKYLVEDASEHAKFEKTPLLYRIKNDRRCRYAKELIADAMARAEAAAGEEQNVDYASIAYEPTEQLIDRGLVRIIEVRRRTDGAGAVMLPYEEDPDDEDDVKEAPVEEPEEPEEELIEEPAEEPVAEAAEEPAAAAAPVEEPAEGSEEEPSISVAAAETMMADDEAEALVEVSEHIAVRGKQTIVNVDTLGEYFSNGEQVTLEKMKERIPFLNKKATEVKVLARGVLTKKLEVEADDFSLAAVKMIVLMGGKVSVTKK